MSLWITSHMDCRVESHTWTWVYESLHIWSRVAHMNILLWVTSHIESCHTHEKESCHTYEYESPHIWMSHFESRHTYELQECLEKSMWHQSTSFQTFLQLICVTWLEMTSWLMSHMWEWVMSHIWEWVMSHICEWVMSHIVTPLFRQSRNSYVRHDSCSYVWHDSFLYVWDSKPSSMYENESCHAWWHGKTLSGMEEVLPCCTSDNESCHIYENESHVAVALHVWMSHFESRHTYELQECLKRSKLTHVTHMRMSHVTHTRMSHVTRMSCANVWEVPSWRTCETWLFHVRVYHTNEYDSIHIWLWVNSHMAHHMWIDSFTWLIHYFQMWLSHSHIWVMSHIREWVMSHVWHGSSITSICHMRK